MRTFSAYAIIVLGIISFAYFLPYFYGIVTVEKPASKIVYYSPVIEDFVMINIDKKNNITYSDRVGNGYSLKEFKHISPIMYYRDLHMKGEFPETVAGVFLTAEDVRREFEVVYFKPDEVNKASAKIKLYPLYESKGDSANMEFPKELFKIDDRMEFIVGATKKVNEEKSELFTSALKEKGFNFPANVIGGNVNPQKQYDWGYFVTDATGDLFHIYQERGLPVVFKVPFDKEQGEICAVYINENPWAKYYGFVATSNGKIFAVMKKTHAVNMIPAATFNPFKHTVRIYVDPLHYTVKVYGDKSERTTVSDREFNEKDSYESPYPSNTKKGFEEVSEVIFPFAFMDQRSNPKAPITIVMSEKPVYAFIFSLFLAIVYMVAVLRKEGAKATLWIDGIIIALSGIYGLLAILILNKERRRYFGGKIFN